jgi:transposase InsO family protein
VADITYIRLRAEFVYLAVILNGFSRKVVGWALDTTLATRLPLIALHQALFHFVHQTHKGRLFDEVEN